MRNTKLAATVAAAMLVPSAAFAMQITVPTVHDTTTVLPVDVHPVIDVHQPIDAHPIDAHPVDAHHPVPVVHDPDVHHPTKTHPMVHPHHPTTDPHHLGTRPVHAPGGVNAERGKS